MQPTPVRTIADHKVNPANDQLTITATDQPGSGGANHRYEIDGFKASKNPSRDLLQPDASLVLLFQNGPISEVGVNGLTNEALLAIIVDRMRSFQAGPYACRENALALTKLEEAQHWLHSRTRARMERGVEGTHRQ
jgi:hypothetical protein